MLFRSSIIACALVSIVFVSGVQAKTFNAASFLGIDRNADNMISSEEAKHYRNTYFATMDRDSDGSVSFEEYAVTNQLIDTATGKPEKMDPPAEFKAVDTDKDKKLTLEEFLAHGTSLFELLDKNKDKLISKEEYIAPGL